MTRALELAKFGRESPPSGVVVGTTDSQTLSSKTFSDGPVFSSHEINAVPYLNASRVLSSSSTFVFDGTNMGLGIAAPAATLHVNASGGGTIRASRSSVGGEYIQLDHDGTDGTIRVSGNNKLNLLTNGNTRIAIAGDGSVGIGLTNPSTYKLTVRNTISSATNTDKTIVQFEDLYNNGSNGQFLKIIGGANGMNLVSAWSNLHLGARGGSDGSETFTSHLSINGNGNVGIGTLSATYKLEVLSGTEGSGQVPLANFRTGSSTAGYNAGFLVYGTASATAANRSVIAIWDADAANAVGGDYFYINKLGNSGDVQLYQASNAAMTFSTNNTERIRILAGGNVSFGSTGTADKPVHLTGTGTRQYFKAETTTNSLSNESGFEIKTPNSNFLIGSHGSTNALWIYDANATTERLRIDSAGLVTVNKTGISLQLGTAANNSGVAMLFAGSNNNKNWLIATQYNVNNALEFTPTSTGGGLTNSGSPVMVMLATGKVGIGTTNPGNTLTVSGDLRVEHSGTGSFGVQALGTSASGTGSDIFLAGQSGYSNGFTVRYNGSTMAYAFQDGNVGIGTTGPTSTLGVLGYTDLGNQSSSSLSSQYYTRLSGYALRYDASNRYGSYGQLVFHANDQWTASARRWMITNGHDANKFAIIRSSDANTDPTLGDAGGSSLADFWITNVGQVNIKQPLYIAGYPASSLYAINIKNTDMTDNSSSFDYILNGASGGNTYWNIVKDSIINFYSTSGGHYGTWGRQVYLEAGYWRIKGSVRLSSSNGAIHGSTSASNYQYTASFRFVISGGPDTGSLKWSVDSLGDGTRAAFSSDASYKEAGLYTISFNTSGYDGIKQVYITDLELERVA